MLTSDRIRKVRVMAVGLLVLITVLACVPKSEPGQPTVSGTVATLPLPSAASAPGTNTPTAVAPMSPSPATNIAAGSAINSETPATMRENVAVLGYGRTFIIDKRGLLVVENGAANLAIDGDLDSAWNSQQYAPQWFSVVLNDLYLVDRLQLVVTQAPAGPTTHEVWLGDGSGTQTLYKRFSKVHTEDGQTLDVAIEPPRSVNEVLILTLDSPSWVAWREVRVFGSLSEDPIEGAETPQVALVEVARGFELPVQITHAGDGSGRLFVVEQKGRIRVIRRGRVPESSEAAPGNAALFLDISHLVSCCSERGLLNVAFPPAYATRQHFYVSYTNTDGATTFSRFRTTADPDRADPGSEEVLLVIDQPEESHNGGRMAFGPKDGYLYIGSGDGGKPNSFAETAQTSSILLGKILRIDVESDVKPYGIPVSNPFVQVEGYRDEIWALGVRNPWGFAFDKETGAFYIPDVGHAGYEEVNYQPASSAGGINYGWFIMEASRCFPPSPLPCRAKDLTLPVAEYDHSQGCAIVGGVVYRGTKVPRLQGVFLYADFCSGRIWGLQRSDAGAQDGWQNTLLINASVPVSSIGEDEEGNVYVVGYQDGSISIITER